MKRSAINREIHTAKKLFKKNGFRLPPFAFWSVEDWIVNHPRAGEIIENRLGWDVTDYGGENFDELGLLLFTLRNGSHQSTEKYPKTYAEKIMVIKDGQISPMHFHWKKTEDIINRGGGNLVLEMHLAASDEGLSGKPFNVSIDGMETKIQAGQPVILKPGESIFLTPFVYHCFYAQKGSGPVVIGEVSQVNDDEHDNRFFDPIGRFPSIEEDEPPLHLLCTDYEKWINLTHPKLKGKQKP